MLVRPQRRGGPLDERQQSGVSDTHSHDELSVLGLLEFLSELDSTHTPPVYNISTERIY